MNLSKDDLNLIDENARVFLKQEGFSPSDKLADSEGVGRLNSWRAFCLVEKLGCVQGAQHDVESALRSYWLREWTNEHGNPVSDEQFKILATLALKEHERRNSTSTR